MARAFHGEVVAPLVAAAAPRLRYLAGRLGSGSDVLGLDDAMSRDHDWGCRLTLLVDEADRGALPLLDGALERGLPEHHHGLPVRFGTTWDPATTHRVELATVTGFTVSRLGIDPLSPMSALDWLSLTGQSVLEATAGPVFRDTTVEFDEVRRRLRWYPPDVERYVLAAGWQRLSQSLPFVGRTAQRGQQVQSRVICAALVSDLMRLGFLLCRRWPPYPKWTGTMFGALPVSESLSEPLRAAVAHDDWRQREEGLCTAIEVLLDVQRRRGLPAPRTGVRAFWDRPYRTVAPDVVEGLLADITDPVLQRLPPGIGSVEQWVDNTDVLSQPGRRVAVAAAYRSWLSAPSPDADSGTAGGQRGE